MNPRQRTPLLLLLLLLISTPDLLALTAIHGTVTDAQTGLPLSPATIQIQGTYHATITNDQGQFQLKVNTFPVTVLFSHIGYASHRISLTDTSGSEHHIRLAPIAYELEERVVTSRNTAEDIMRRVIQRKQTWWPALKTLKVEAYTRFTTRNDTGIVSITESLSDAHWDHELGWREIVKSKRQTANRRR